VRIVGKTRKGATTILLSADQKRVARYNVAGAAGVPKLSAWLDGLGAGSGEAQVRGVIYDASGNLIAQGDDVTVHSGDGASWVDLPFPEVGGVQLGAPGLYDFGVHVGGAVNVVRAYDPGSGALTTNSPLTTSGNEITDMVRAAAIQGDGRGYEYVFNLVANGGFEVNATGWSASGSTVVRSTAQAKFGTASGLVTATGAGLYSGFSDSTLSGATLGLSFVGSMWIFAEGSNVGNTLQLQLWERGGASGDTATTVTTTLAAGWNRYVVSRTLTANDRTSTRIQANVTAAGAGAYHYIDGVQVEAGLIAHDFVNTQGAAAGAVQGPLALNLCSNGGFEIDATGWTALNGTVARSTAQSFDGAASGLWTSAAAGAVTLRYINVVTGAPLSVETYTFSLSVFAAGAAVGRTFTMQFNEIGGASATAAIASSAFVLTAGWQRLTITGKLAQADRTGISLVPTYSASAAGETVYIDAVQVERALVASPYIDTSGVLRASAVAAVDSSTGIWEGTTNLCTNGGFETGTTGWALGGAGGVASLAVDSGRSKFGQKSGKVVAGAAVAGFGDAAVTVPAAGTYTASAWIYIPSSWDGQAPTLGFATFSGVSGVPAVADLTKRDQWQRLTVTDAITAGTLTGAARLRNPGGASAGVFFYADGVQLESGSVATPYVHTDGATATRAAGRVQAPASLLDATQFWASFRVRVPVGLASGSVNTLFGWTVGAATQLYWLYWTGTGWKLERRARPAPDVSVTVADASAAGTSVLVTIAVTATQIKLSVNGAPFTVAASTAIPAGLPATFDIGSLQQFGTSFELDSDVLWGAWGTGTPTDADVASLYALGNTDPLWGALPALPTMLWTADDASYIYTLTGRYNVDTFSDGASTTFGPSTPSDIDLSVFATTIAPYPSYTFPDETDEHLASLPFLDSQRALTFNTSTAVIVTGTCGWHGTRTDERQGSFAVVRSGGPFANLVGERVRITTRTGKRRSVVAYVHNESAELVDDLSITRRLFMEIGQLATDALDVRLEVLG
jgi:hypothetical protein